MRLSLTCAVCVLLVAAAAARPDGSFYFPDASAEDQFVDEVVPLGRSPPDLPPRIGSIFRNNLVRSNFQIYHSREPDARPARPVIRENERRV